MRNLLKSMTQSMLSAVGYELHCTRYIASKMLLPEHVINLNFQHVVCTLMHKLRRQQLTFLQIGAFDGVSSDPLREFVHEYGWRGVLVEPQPSAYKKLVENYREQANLLFKNFAVSKTSGTLTLYTVSGEGLPDWCGGLAGFSRESIEKHEAFAPGISQKILPLEVPTVTFEELLAELPSPELDLLQIDTEGFDAQLLAMFPFEKIRPHLIHFERKHLSVRDLDKCLSHLAENGYKFAFDGGEDMIACRDN